MSIWKALTEKAKDIDAWRKLHMSFAEWADAWRLVPRTIVLCYGYMTWAIVQWYMELKPYVIEGCNIEVLKELCIVNEPTTEHMALVTAVAALAVGVFGLYTNSGRKWNGFTHWNPLKGETSTPPPPAKEEEKTGE